MGRYTGVFVLLAIVLLVLGHRRQSNKLYGAGVAALLLAVLWG